MPRDVPTLGAKGECGVVLRFAEKSLKSVRNSQLPALPKLKVEPELSDGQDSRLQAEHSVTPVPTIQNFCHEAAWAWRLHFHVTHPPRPTTRRPCDGISGPSNITLATGLLGQGHHYRACLFLGQLPGRGPKRRGPSVTHGSAATSSPELDNPEQMLFSPRRATKQPFVSMASRRTHDVKWSLRPGVASSALAHAPPSPGWP